jgi:hypothetical protein
VEERRFSAASGLGDETGFSPGEAIRLLGHEDQNDYS